MYMLKRRSAYGLPIQVVCCLLFAVLRSLDISFRFLASTHFASRLRFTRTKTRGNRLSRCCASPKSGVVIPWYTSKAPQGGGV